MAEKFYGIIYNDNFMYVPIKSATNPYNPKKPHFCACMPNFFGGRDDTGEGPVATLRREIEEESQEIITATAVLKAAMTKIHDIDLPNNHQGTTRSGDVIRGFDDYYFYAIHADGVNIGFHCDSYSLMDKVGEIHPHKREFQYIVRVPKEKFIKLADSDVRLCKLLEICNEIAAGTQEQKTNGANDFNGSETKRAFVEFFKFWL